MVRVEFREALIQEIMRRDITSCKAELRKLNVVELQCKLEKLNCERR